MIKINKKKNTFYLETKSNSYIFGINDNTKQLETIYFGLKIDRRENIKYKITNYKRSFSSWKNDHLEDSLDSRPLEFSTLGFSDYKSATLDISVGNNSLNHFEYKNFKIEKYSSLNSLPSAYDADETLVITLEDKVKKIIVELRYTPFYNSNIFVKNIKIINGGDKKVTINKLLSANIDFIDPKKNIISLDGSWARERHVNFNNIENNLFKISSKEGTSSSTHNPFIAIGDKNLDNNIGEVYGASLIYSSNFEINYEIHQYNIGRLSIGINSDTFSWDLNPSESFETPQAVFSFSNEGLNGLSQNFHNFIKNNISPKKWSFKERPVLLNNWEATYFDFNEEVLLKLAKKAKDIGIELFCLDDGWFGKRNDDTSSLGDWFDNKKLPNGIKGLSEKINKLGLDFGIWVEPEMVSPDSELFRNHPEWAINNPDYPMVKGRNQLILDLTKNEVIEYLEKTLSDVIKRSNAKYVKWDMNRPFGHSPYKGFEHKYIINFYKLLKNLTDKFPEVLFEGCSAGGCRFDMGVLSYFPQIWTSDDTDAYERTKIQYGTSIIYPLNVISNHVSEVPNHQVNRTIDLETRSNVAFFGILGYEINLLKSSNEELRLMEDEIKTYKSNRKIVLESDFYRIKSPFDSNIYGWQTISQDKSLSFLLTFKKNEIPNDNLQFLKLSNLNEENIYKINNELISGKELKNFGFHFSQDMNKGDFKSKLYKLVKK